MRETFKKMPIYAITDTQFLCAPSGYLDVEMVLARGVKWIQYRDKSKDGDKRAAESKKLLSLCEKYNAKLIINDDISLAKKIGAHGVHIGQSDMNLTQARTSLGNTKIIGVTCHDDINLAKNAQDLGADYVAFGRFFNSQTKPNAQHASLGVLKEASKVIQLPIIAIGGINARNCHQVISAGADTFAVCQSLFGSPNIDETLNEFLSSIEATE